MSDSERIARAVDRLSAFTPPGCVMSMGIYTRNQIEAMVRAVLNTDPPSVGDGPAPEAAAKRVDPGEIERDRMWCKALIESGLSPMQVEKVTAQFNRQRAARREPTEAEEESHHFPDDT